MEGRDPLTLEQVGEKIGITRERVRQLQEQAIRHARKKIHQYSRQFSREEIDEQNKINERKKILEEILGSSKGLSFKDFLL